MDFAATAVEAEFSYLGVRTLAGSPSQPPADMACLIRDAAEVSALKSFFAAEGIVVRELEYVMLNALIRIAECRQALEMGAELGTRYLVAIGNDNDQARLIDNAAALAALAAEYDMRVMIEFVPWLSVNSLQAAQALTSALPDADIGILIDMLHLFRSGGTAADVSLVRGDLTPYLQVCDAPAKHPLKEAELRRQSSTERMDPGTGGFDLGGVLKARTTGLPISVEVPNDARVQAIGAVAHAQMIRVATEKLLDGLDAGSTAL